MQERFVIATSMPGTWTTLISIVLLALSTIVIAGLLIRTLVGIGQGQLRTLSARVASA